MPADPVRDAAVDVLLRVFERGVHLDVSIDKTLRRRPDFAPRGRRFLAQLCYGAVRHRLLCDHVLSGICTQPLDKLPPAILVILRMAVFQGLFLSQVTRPAMVHTAVDLAQKRSHAGLARMVNAVLRRAPQSLDDVALPDPETQPVEFLRVRHSMPRWLVREWVEGHGVEKAAEFCAAVNTQAPAALRVNTLKTTPEKLAAMLQKQGISTVKATPVPEELTVVDGGNPVETRAFRDGLFMLQDPASLLPGHLMEPRPGEKVLDMCAAPGGKTTHMAQLAGGGAAIAAMDGDWRRLGMLVDNVDRLGLTGVFPLCGSGFKAPFADETFDRVLVDAPCSGLGTLRRHPDLKWRITPETSERLAGEQALLLREALRLCKNGGLVVYSVCTFARRETRGVVETVSVDGLCAAEDGPELLIPWKTAKGQYQTGPAGGALDGFFLTRFRKQS